MSLSCKFAHEETSLVVCKSEPLHLSLLSADFSGSHWRFVLVFGHVVTVVVLVFGDDVVALDLDVVHSETVVG